MEIYQLKVSHEKFIQLADDGFITCSCNKNRIKKNDVIMIGDFLNDQYYNRFLLVCVDDILKLDHDNIEISVSTIIDIVYDVWGFF